MNTRTAPALIARKALDVALCASVVVTLAVLLVLFVSHVGVVAH